MNADDRQGTLLSPTDNLLHLPHSLPHSDDNTSKAAAKSPSVKSRAGVDRVRIMTLYRSRGTKGATADEVQEALGINALGCGARVSELVNRYGQLKDSGKRRATRAGRTATVYVVDELAPEE